MQGDILQACPQCCSKVSHAPTKDLETFDDLCLAFNNNSLKINFEKTPCTSAKARKHIQRPYYQQHLWIQAPLKDASLERNAESYGFTFVKKQDGKFNSSWYCYPQPEDLPDPCTCDKCAHKKELHVYVAAG